jgi:hypothetical protein
VLVEPDSAAALREATDVDDVLARLNPPAEEVHT